MKKYLLSISLLILITSLSAQEKLPRKLQSKYHMIFSSELKNKDAYKGRDFVTTAPPEGGARSIAEFERNQGVIVAYPPGSFLEPAAFGIPTTLIAELAEDVTVYVICTANDQSSAEATLNNAGVNMTNVEFVNAQVDSHWARDYSPWFIEYGEDNKLGIVNFPYNRPRPNDNEIPNVFGQYFNLEVFGMNIEQTGGNYMTDGMGISASCDLVYSENQNLSPNEVAEITNNYLGAETYHLVPDPLDDYIEHIDCWGKFLDVDKILIASVPASDDRYADFEAMADYWRNTTTPYGNKYQVYRTAWVQDGNAYTNSLIMNNKVFVPFNNGTAGNYNLDAAEVYEEAMPGYEIIGISYDNWFSTDALHCRTHEVPDLEMLRILHYPILDTVEYQECYEFSADVYVFNNSASINSVELFYSVNYGNYQSVPMSLTSDDTYTISISDFNPGETISYYIKAVDANSKTETNPFIGEADPHVFTIHDLTQKPILSKEAYIKAFPNPANDELYFIVNDLPNESIECNIFNQQGKMVLSINKENYSQKWNMKKIDISALKPGLYFIKAFSEKNVYTTKFIKL